MTPSLPHPSRAPSYPWSIQKLRFPTASASKIDATSAQPSSPFPRYGHSIPAQTTPNGDLLLFGGLVDTEIRNDLFVINPRDLTVAPLQTTYDVPPPRVGHASAIRSNVLIVWGGDTSLTSNDQDNDSRDNELYLLNLGVYASVNMCL